MRRSVFDSSLVKIGPHTYVLKNGRPIFVHKGGKPTSSSDRFSLESDKFLQAHRLERKPTHLEVI